MGTEIERKFLVRDGEWRNAKSTAYRQGYLNTDKERTVRVRAAGDRGFITVKGITQGAKRAEYEYEIPLADAEEMLSQLCKRPLVEKRRHEVPYSGLTWEVDEFFGENDGLVVAEIELESEDQAFEKPPWVGEEVTGDPHYYNANLAERPFSKW